MKKFLFLMLLVLTLIMTSCAGNKSEPVNEPATQAPSVTENPAAEAPKTEKPTQHISIGTAGTGGYFYPLGGAIADVINRFVEGAEATAETTGGSAENVTLVGTNEVQMGMANGNLVYAGYYGEEPYTEKYEDIRGMFAIQPSVVQMVTLEGSGINSIGDLKGKKVVVGPAGGGQVVLFDEYIKYYDMTMDDINAVYISYTDGINDLLDGNADAVLVMAAMPTGALVELSARSDNYKIIEFEDEIIEKVVNSSPYFTKFIVPGGTYKGIDKDAQTIAATSVMMCRADMDEELVYEICKQIYSHLDILVTTVDSAKVMTVENGIDVPIPMHPGAERFFKEQGVLK